MEYLSMGWGILPGEESWCLCHSNSPLTLLAVTAPSPELRPFPIPSSDQGFFSSERLFQGLFCVSQ